MSPVQINTSKRFQGEATGKDAEQEVELSISKESLSSSSDGSSQVQQDENSFISNNNTFLASTSMPPRSYAVTGDSNAQFVSTPIHQQSITPNTMDLLPKTEALQQPFTYGQDTNHNVMRNEQFLLPRHMSRSPYGATENSYNYPTSNLPADYRLDQMRIGATPPFIKAQMARMLQNYQQMVDNPDFNPFEPLYVHPQELMTQVTGYPSTGPCCHRMLLNTAVPQQGMKGSTGLALNIHSEVGDSSDRGQKRKKVYKDESPSSNPDKLLNWFPQGLGDQKPELGGPSTSIPRYNISLYDPAFERMDLPVDPHLRLFLGSTSHHVN